MNQGLNQPRAATGLRQQSSAMSPVPSASLKRWIWAVLVWLAMAAVACALLARWSFERARDEAAIVALARLTADAGELQSALEKFETLPFVVSLQSEVTHGLQHAQDANAIGALNRYLVKVQRHAKVGAVYVLDSAGLTIAASNWDRRQTFVGNNYRFRPYAQSALAGQTGRFYGIGSTTAEPGYFLSQPVVLTDAALNAGNAERGTVIGAVVIKLNLQDYEKSWPLNEGAVALVDHNGVIFLSNLPAWKYHGIHALDTAAQAAIAQTRQYADYRIEPLNLAAPALDTGHFFAQRVGGLDWRLMRFVPEAAARRAAWNAAAAGLLLSIIAGLLAFLLWQRREHRHSAAAGRRALVEAASELESQIALRTRDVVAINQALEQRLAQVHETEQLLRHTQTELIQAGKLGMLGQMAAGMTHELSQPLTALRAFADNATLFIDRGDIGSARENLAHIEDACLRMGRLVGQLKAFARKSPGVPEPFDLAPSIENAARLLRSNFEGANATLTIRIHRVARVVGDSIRMEQVLINLIRNGLDAVRACERRQVDVELDADDLHALLRIADSGPGIAPQARDHLFEPFFTTKPPGEGLGLGLAISSSIVQAMEGTLSVSNAPGNGAVFTLRLPLYQELPQ